MPPPVTTFTALKRPDTVVGVLLRVAFFVASVYAGSTVLETMAASAFDSLFLGAILGGFATGMLANFITMRIFDGRSLIAIGLGNGPGTGKNALIGLALGSGAAILLLSAPLLAGSGHLVPRDHSDFSWLSIVFYLVMLVFGAAGEEAIFHGYAFQVLVQKLGPFATVLPVGLLFGIAHATNPNANKLGILNTALWGILLGFAFVRSHDLWLPIGMHYGWNAVLPLFGVNLSGITIEVTRYSYRWDLAPLWSGGTYGPEGGLLATIFICVLFFALARAPISPQVAVIAPILNDSD